MRILLVLGLLCANCWAEIVEIHSLDALKEHFQKSDSSTYGVFDIDMVLIQPDEPAFQLANIEKYLPIVKRVILSVPPEKRDILYTLTSLYYDSALVDEGFPSFFQNLNERNIPSFGLTASMTGSLLHESCLESWKCDHLRKQGIDFEAGAPCRDRVTFVDLAPYRGNYPLFYDGVLFTNGGHCCSKGELLVTFLRDIHLSPKEIIFTDDKLDNLKSVESALLAYDPAIHFVGLHYLGARYFPSEPLSEEEFTTRWEVLAAEAITLD